MGVGFGEIIVIFGLLGGMLGGGAGEQQAPRDGADQAIKWVLPDAHVALYADVEAAVGNGFAVLDELDRLPLLQTAPEMAEALREMRRSVDAALGDVQREMGVDARHGVGDVTFSMSISQASAPRMLARVRGKFPVEDVIRRVAGDGAATETLHGHTLTTLQTSDTDSVVATALDETTLVVGPRSSLDELLGGRPFPATEGSTGGRLGKLVTKKTTAFVYLAPPAWLTQQMMGSPAEAGLARFIDGIDYVAWAAAPDKAIVRVGARTDETAGRSELLLKAASSMLVAFDPLTDALVQGAAALLPLVAEGELGPELHKLVSNERGMLELGAWFKKRFGGKGKVTRDAKKGIVDLELSNPASLPALIMPLMSAGAWLGVSKAETSIMEAPADEMLAPDEPAPIDEPTP